MATQIQFKKVASLPEQLEKGTVYFNSTTHSIFVAKTTSTTDEFGGRIKDIEYKDNVLTITKYDTSVTSGEATYTLDFSDVASSEDVSKVLYNVWQKINSLENSVSTNAGNIATNTTAIKALQDTLGTGDESLATRVTSAEKEIDTLETTVYGTLKEDGTRDTDGLNTKVTNNANAIANKAEKGGSSEQTFKVSTPKDNSDATPKSYVDNKISEAVSSVYRVKGCLDNKEALLKITNPSVGDVYNVTSEVTVESTEVGSGVGKFGKAGTFSAGTNWVWVKHSSDTSQATGETTTTEHWDAIGGMITGYATDTQVADVSTRVTKLEKGENTVKTFGGQYGVINVKTAETTDANGTVQFTVTKTSTSDNVNTSKLTATVKGLAGAAYKNVSETSTNVANPIENNKNNNYIPTNSAVAAAIASEHSAITNEIKNNSTMTWAEWPTS